MNLVGVGGAVRISTCADGLVDVVGKGPLSSAEIMGVMEVAWFGRRRLQPGSYRALIVDLRAAHLPDMLEIAKGKGRFPGFISAARELPLAFVMPDELIEVTRAYCLHCAMQGAVMGAFTEPGLARLWVSQRAAAMSEQRRMRSPGKLPRMLGGAAPGP